MGEAALLDLPLLLLLTTTILASSISAPSKGSSPSTRLGTKTTGHSRPLAWLGLGAGLGLGLGLGLGSHPSAWATVQGVRVGQ